MSETALAALYRAVVARLDGVADKVWADRVYTDAVAEGTAYPYVWIFWSGGREANLLQRRDADQVLTIQCVSESLEQAFAGAEQIADALNDHGEQDTGNDDALYGGAYWHILSVTEEDTIHLHAPFAGAAPIFQCGARYRFIMEAK